MKARQLAQLLLVVHFAVTAGCQDPRLAPLSPDSAPPPASSPSASVRGGDGADAGRTPLLSRAVSAEELEPDDLLRPERSNIVAPGELQVLPLNPVFDLLKGNTAAQTNDVAYQTLTLLGLSATSRLMRGLGGAGGRHGFRRAADFTDDLLQPDEELQRGRRPPYVFGLELKY